jgi:hypothetical protein
MLRHRDRPVAEVVEIVREQNVATAQIVCHMRRIVHTDPLDR